MGLLTKMGLSPQRPLYSAYQQDPERVEEWKKSAYPKIRELAAEEGASIFFADEVSIRTDHHAGTTWAPAGQTPVVVTLRLLTVFSWTGHPVWPMSFPRLGGGVQVQVIMAGDLANPGLVGGSLEPLRRAALAAREVRRSRA
jgi:hypothetical protein